MKVIFLDIDGVLNNYPFLYSRNKDVHDDKINWEVSFFDPKNVENLNKITKKIDAKLVISSSWRIGKTVEHLQELFELVGVEGEVIDKTIRLEFSNWGNSVPRGMEILHWINKNKGILGKNLLSWKDYVIIDDESDMLYWQRKNFFKTDPEVGLTPNLTYRIINHLK